MNTTNKTIISLLVTVASGVTGFLLVKKFGTKKLVEIVEEPAKIFHNQKDDVMTMVEESRKKFNEKNHYPQKHDRKADIHNQNHNHKSYTKPTFN
ncbi:MAG: hypothetical protein H7263_01920 [Candidatus Sericytochromatia bacterium]|nr:hypothetical protein [Candidatus Sericytochromatia bacterium]